MGIGANGGPTIYAYRGESVLGFVRASIRAKHNDYGYDYGRDFRHTLSTVLVRKIWRGYGQFDTHNMAKT